MLKVTITALWLTRSSVFILRLTEAKLLNTYAFNSLFAISLLIFVLMPPDYVAQQILAFDAPGFTDETQSFLHQISQVSGVSKLGKDVPRIH
jgi:hypothetical protein